MRVNSLAFRLFATSSVWTFLVLPIAGFIIYSLYHDDVQASFDGQLLKLVTALNIDSMSGTGDEPLPPRNRYEPLFEETHSGWYWQIKPIDGATGERLVSPSLATGALESPYEKGFPSDDTGTRWMNVTGPAGEPIRIVEVIGMLGLRADAPRFSVIVAGPLEWLDDIVTTFRIRLTVALALAGLGLLAATLFQVRFGLLPLRSIERGLSDIRSGESERLDGVLPAEIEPLQNELNALIKSNQDIIDRARTQVGNLAHALKTPLAVIVNESRDDKGPFAHKVAEQAQIMRDSIDLYLDRARMAARVGVIGRVTVVASVVDPLVRAIERIHRDKSLSVTVSCPEAARFQGERQDLEEMLGNLLDNAAKWARRQVFLNVSAPGTGGETRGKPREIIIMVEDDGPGLTAEQRERIGKRGLRLDETKPGSGLGLSIVTDLVQSYRGGFELEQSPHGGVRAVMRLPAA